MTVADKNRARLAVLEADLWTRLTAELRNVAAGRNTLFFSASEYNAHSLPAHMLPTGTGEILAMAADALNLRNELGEPCEDTVGALFLDALKRANDTSNHNRIGPRRLAKDLLPIDN